MFILDNLFIGGIKFVVDHLATVADAEQHGRTAFRRRLQDARARLERGEIDAARFAEIKRRVTTGLVVLRRGD